MLKLSDILKAEGVPAEKTKLVRHSDKSGIGAYQLWLTDIAGFEEYQSVQGRFAFNAGDFVASFVAPPSGETIFVGLYEVIERYRNREALTCPLSGFVYQAGKAHQHTMRRSPLMQDYIGTLVIDWTTIGRQKPSQTFVQGAHDNPKPVLEIRREVQRKEFPGFRNFYAEVEHLNHLPDSWKMALASVWGIYLLVCNATGKQYVGAAYGVDGILGRLLQYKSPQAVGNKRLVRHDRSKNLGRGYRCCVLDVITPGVSVSEIAQLESQWKEKLQTRGEWGLNEN